MRHRVFLLPPARKDFLSLPRKVRDPIMEHPRALAVDPGPPASERMTGDQRGRWRLRIGDYRAVYTIEDQTLTVEVLVVAHRSRAYKIAARRRS